MRGDWLLLRDPPGLASLRAHRIYKGQGDGIYEGYHLIQGVSSTFIHRETGI